MRKIDVLENQDKVYWDATNVYKGFYVFEINSVIFLNAVLKEEVLSSGKNGFHTTKVW